MDAPSQRGWFADLLDNPILRREGVPRLVRRASPRVRVILAVVALSGSFLLGAYLATLTAGFSEVIATAAVSAWSGLSLLVAAFSSSRAIAQERMSGTWDALIISRLGGRGIVLGVIITIVAQFGAMTLMFLASDMPTAHGHDALSGIIHLTLLVTPGFLTLVDLLTRFDTLDAYHRRS